MDTSPILLFLSNVAAHHLGWIGLILTVVGVIEKITNTTIVTRPRWIIGIGVALLFISCCQAWLDEHRNVTTLISDKARLSSELNQRTATPPLVTIQNNLDPRALAQAYAALARQEKQNNQSPLSNKLLALSKRILVFALERGRLVPQRSVSFDRDTVDKEWQDGVRFSQETQNQYALKFGAELAALIGEVKATGVDTDDWDWRCGAAYAGSTLMSIQQCASQLGVFADQVR